METSTGNQNIKLAGVFLIGVVVGAFGLWMWTATQSALSEIEPEQTVVVVDEVVTEEETAVTQDFDNQLSNQQELRSDSIVVRKQPAGTSVVVEKATLEENGWVVIHEGTASHIGNALGAARFDTGVHSGVVELLRATEAGVTYRAVLYRDNGDKEFSLDTDFPFLENGNQPILTTFIVE